MTQATARTYVELEVTLTATFEPADAEVGAYHTYEDHEIIGLCVYRYQVGGKHQSIDLLRGVNVRSPDVQQLLANLTAQLDLDAWACEADENLSAEAERAEDFFSRAHDEQLMAGQAGRGL